MTVSPTARLDGVDGFYWGRVTLDGRMAKLARELSDRDYLQPKISSKRKTFAGAIFQVLSGAGAGQWARVIANTKLEVELDRELEHGLDVTSMVSIVPYRGNLMFVANTYEDGGPFQLYGDAHSCLIAENTGARMDGFSGVGLVRWGWNPNWFNLFVDNVILEGNALGGLTAGFAASGAFAVKSETNGGDWSIPSHDPTGYLGNLSAPLQLGAVFRRNIAMSNTRITIDGSSEVILVEHNHLSKAPVGIHVTNRTADVYLIGNTFEDVHQEYCYDTPGMHQRACYYPPTVGPAGLPPSTTAQPVEASVLPGIDPLTGVRIPKWRMEQQEPLGYRSSHSGGRLKTDDVDDSSVLEGDASLPAVKAQQKNASRQLRWYVEDPRKLEDFLLGNNSDHVLNISSPGDITGAIYQCCTLTIIHPNGSLGNFHGGQELFHSQEARGKRHSQESRGPPSPLFSPAWAQHGVATFATIAVPPRNCTPTGQPKDKDWPCITTGEICNAALARLPDFVHEVLEFTDKYGLTGVHLDEEYGFGNNLTCHLALWGSVRKALNAAGKQLAMSIDDSTGIPAHISMRDEGWSFLSDWPLLIGIADVLINMGTVSTHAPWHAHTHTHAQQATKPHVFCFHVA